MNLNIEKTKKLIGIFAELDEDNQDVLLTKAFEMQIKQSVASNLARTGKDVTEQSVNAKMGKMLDVVGPLLDVWDDMSPNHHAALAILLNEMTKGELAKEEYIDFVVKTRQLTISEYIEKYIPGADVEESKKIYKSLRLDK